jgi:DNA-binding NtrC family response regulator
MAYDKVQPTKIAYADGRPQTLHLRKANLVLAPGTEHQHELSFDQTVITVGSLEDNDIVLDDETVSRHHCRIVQEDSDYVVVDRSSTNGTFVNGVRIREAYLAPGQIIGVGNAQIRFQPVDEQIPVRPSASETFGGIVGRSVEMREIFGILEKIAPTSATVVIEGETGTGKEVVARTIHDMSKRADESFIVFDCGAVPESLIESELFGHEKGSFTGAIMTRKGLFEMAQGGTIFLDELGELSLDLQPKLLRVLEQREVRRVGSNKAIPVNVRVIAATNRKLEDEVAAGRFREDLFYRLSVVRVQLPPLRDRSEDIPLLVRHFLHTQGFNRDENDEMRVSSIEAGALEAMSNYTWPGNVRELLNIVERACSFSDQSVITLDDLPDYVVETRPDPAVRPDRSPADEASDEFAVPPPDFDVPDKAALADLPFKRAKDEWITSFERDYIFDLLRRHRGNISQAAREADIDRKYFRKLMDKHGIEADDVT